MDCECFVDPTGETPVLPVVAPKAQQNQNLLLASAPASPFEAGLEKA